MRYNCNHMCDAGVSETVESLLIAINEVLFDLFNTSDNPEAKEFAFDAIGEMVFSGARIQRIPGQTPTIASWGGIQKMIYKYIEKNFDNAIETLVCDIDEHMGTIKEGAYEQGYESASETMFSEDCMAEKKEEILELESRIEAMEDRIEDLENEEIEIDGEEFRFDHESLCYISRNGTILKLQKSEDSMPNISIARVWS